MLALQCAVQVGASLILAHWHASLCFTIAAEFYGRVYLAQACSQPSDTTGPQQNWRTMATAPPLTMLLWGLKLACSYYASASASTTAYLSSEMQMDPGATASCVV